MNTRTYLYMIGLTACASTPAPPGTPPFAGRLSPLFAPLFEDGRMFTYDWSVEGNIGAWDAQGGPYPDKLSGQMVCTVEILREEGALMQASLSCDDAGFEVGGDLDLWMARTWAANERGLWWQGAVDAASEEDIAAFLLDPPQLSARPRAGDPNIVRHGKAWCHEMDDDGGDFQSLCFEPGVGLVSFAERLSSGGVDEITQRFVLVR